MSNSGKTFFLKSYTLTGWFSIRKIEGPTTWWIRLIIHPHPQEAAVPSNRNQRISTSAPHSSLFSRAPGRAWWMHDQADHLPMDTRVRP